MRRLKIVLKIILCIAIALCVIGYGFISVLITPKKVVSKGQLKELTSEEKLEDFRYMYNILKDSFPFFKVEKDKTGFDWLANKEKFEKQIEATKSNEEFYYTLSGIVKMIQNGHTGVVTPSRYYGMAQSYTSIMNHPWDTVLNQSGVKNKYETWKSIVKESTDVLPVKIKYVEGKYIATEDYDNIKKGYVLETINEKQIDEYFKSNLDKYYLNYDYKRDKLYISSNLILAEKDKEYRAVFTNKEGVKITEKFTPIAYEQKSLTSTESSSCQQKIIEPNKIAYLKVKSMSNITLISDRTLILEFFKSIKDYPYLILDIRGNGGGTDNYWEENVVAPLIVKKTSSINAMAYRGSYIKTFMRGRGIITKPISGLPEQFKSRYTSEMESFITAPTSVSPENSVGFNGKIFLLVDDAVYSSSESFAAFCKGTGFAEIVGTNTGGDGIGIDPCVMALPNSGLVVRFSLDMGINADNTVNEQAHTKPDIYVETTYNDFLEGKDTILNKAVELCK
ncbi:S41 family peptidase [Candidatus Clostridium radicumherbarum]|uniref:S41 family peptidase n=1 Tax=Candidatus Clostridium radicumherbarum TaxID=3381662 RepID=A0ABW8TQJ7_9CLOT